jgi:hypothetical protein
MWRTFVGGAVVDAADGRDVHEVGERAAVALGGGGGQPADERVGAGREQEEEEEEEGREEGGGGGGAHHRLENHRRMCTTDTPNLRKPSSVSSDCNYGEHGNGKADAAGARLRSL